MTTIDDKYHDTTVIPSLRSQITLDIGEPDGYFSAPTIDLSIYDQAIVCVSGKDSIFCLLQLLDSGFDKPIELWHHRVDGNEGSNLVDWAFNDSFIAALGKQFNLPVYFSHLRHGFEGELLKHNSYSHPHEIETPDGPITLQRDTKRAKPNTRRRFPQMSGNLSTRWCSSALKIDVGRRSLNAQERFNHSKTLFITGERREESSQRRRYNQFEPHACDRRKGRLGRHVDTWRAALHISEADVWQKLKDHLVLPPVPYRLGFSRSSCLTCVFNHPRVWSTIAQHFPDRANRIAALETELGSTISRTKKTVTEIASAHKPLNITDTEALDQAQNSIYTLPIKAQQPKDWQLPPGAFSSFGCGSV